MQIPPTIEGDPWRPALFTTQAMGLSQVNCHPPCCAVAKGDAEVTSPGAGLGIWFGGLVVAHVTGPPSPRCWHDPGEKQVDTPGTRATQELPESRRCRQLTALGTPSPDLASGLTPKVSPMSGCTARQWWF